LFLSFYKHRLDRGEKLDGGLPLLAGVGAGLLHAAERGLQFHTRALGVDAHHAGVHVADKGQHVPDVPGEDGGAESEAGIIGHLQGVHFYQRQHRAENLLPGDGHVRRDVFKDSRLHVKSVFQAGRGHAFSAAQQYGSFFESFLDVAEHGLHLPFAGARSHPGVGGEAVAHFQSGHPFQQLLLERVVNGALDDDAAGGRALLAGGAKTAAHGRLHGQIEVGVGRDDDRVFAAHLQLVLGSPGERSQAHLLAHLIGAGERNGGDAGMIDDSLADCQ
jgi:hypothetical protein